MTKISGQILHFEDPGMKYLSENPYYQQLYGEKKAREATESGVEISKFVFYVLQSYLRARLKFQVIYFILTLKGGI